MAKLKSGTRIYGDATVDNKLQITSGPVLVGSATSTGTASQPLQVTGGAYVSVNLGIGTTNPTSTLTVQGTTRITGITSIRDVTIDKSIASPNATVPVAIIGVTTSGISTETNIDVVLLAKGTGAKLAQVPDGTVAGGDKRGASAVDWQTVRSISSRVSSGLRSVIGGGEDNLASNQGDSVLGGYGNRATGGFSIAAGGFNNLSSNSASTVCGGNGNTSSAIRSSVVGGETNTASSNYSFVGGGQSNIAQTNTHATVCGGFTNTASGQYSFVGGGDLHSATASNAVVCGGNANNATASAAFVGGGSGNNASASYAFIGGGNNNLANSTRSFVSGGAYGTTRSVQGYHVFPACSQPIAAVAGVTQSALLLLGRQTTDATATVLTSNTSAAGTTNQVILPNNSAYFFKGSCIAGVTGAGNTKAWEFKGAIKRGANAAATSIVGSVIKDVIASDAGASTWDITITADTTNGGIAVTVTGAASTTIRWVCKIETTEMTY